MPKRLNPKPFGRKASGLRNQDAVIGIVDIVTWIEACRIFLSCQKDLNQYKLFIIQTAKPFSDKSWLNYDVAFRNGRKHLLLDLMTGLI